MHTSQLQRRKNHNRNHQKPPAKSHSLKDQQAAQCPEFTAAGSAKAVTQPVGGQRFPLRSMAKETRSVHLSQNLSTTIHQKLFFIIINNQPFFNHSSSDHSSSDVNQPPHCSQAQSFAGSPRELGFTRGL